MGAGKGAPVNPSHSLQGVNHPCERSAIKLDAVKMVEGVGRPFNRYEMKQCIARVISHRARVDHPLYDVRPAIAP